MEGNGKSVEVCTGRGGVGFERWRSILVEEILETLACRTPLDSKTVIGTVS
jgi:hypothetical protein